MDSEYGTPGMSDNEVLGVLTGQVPVKSAPIAMKGSVCTLCGHVGSAAHDCPEVDSE